jgi:DeoR/GlpR family transcriptional regulator of sugar metabolism
VILIGGRITPGSAGSLGATALLQIQQIKADLCFLGACAFDPIEGVAAFGAEDAELKRAMVQASGQVAVAMTSEKLMTAAPFMVADAASVDHLFVEADVSAERLTQLEAVCDNVTVVRS